jgi:hypothetical protein
MPDKQTRVLLKADGPPFLERLAAYVMTAMRSYEYSTYTYHGSTSDAAMGSICHLSECCGLYLGR